MLLGVFGGSFDPVHRGHLALAEACLEQAALDRLLLIPVARQPLKGSGPQAPDDARLEMAEAALGGRQRCAVSDLELRRGGPSYTIDTLRQLQAEDPAAQLHLLLGDDSLADLVRWREPEAIVALARLVVVGRPDLVSTPPRLADLSPRWPPLRVAMPPLPISSREIRRRIAAGEAWDELVPPAVAAIIRRRGLYGA